MKSGNLPDLNTAAELSENVFVFLIQDREPIDGAVINATGSGDYLDSAHFVQVTVNRKGLLEVSAALLGSFANAEERNFFS